MPRGARAAHPSCVWRPRARRSRPRTRARHQQASDAFRLGRGDRLSDKAMMRRRIELNADHALHRLHDERGGRGRDFGTNPSKRGINLDRGALNYALVVLSSAPLSLDDDLSCRGLRLRHDRGRFDLRGCKLGALLVHERRRLRSRFVSSAQLCGNRSLLRGHHSPKVDAARPHVLPDDERDEDKGNDLKVEGESKVCWRGIRRREHDQITSLDSASRSAAIASSMAARWRSGRTSTPTTRSAAATTTVSRCDASSMRTRAASVESVVSAWMVSRSCSASPRVCSRWRASSAIRAASSSAARAAARAAESTSMASVASRSASLCPSSLASSAARIVDSRSAITRWIGGKMNLETIPKTTRKSTNSTTIVPFGMRKMLFELELLAAENSIGALLLVEHEDEHRHEDEVDEVHSLTETDHDEHDREEATLGLRLTSDPSDRLASCQAIANCRANGAAAERESAADHGAGELDALVQRVCCHVVLLRVRG